ncbi:MULTISPECIES: condensation domain-containing protein [unclassified Streptomyces]|uniref:condensation domain-containing protein n=1 Tax=unclassified Streptomyces TaxID=2593676 RepID=UPI000377786C|nr:MULTISPECIES: condensation domain-containing protein [unclassified Streptomyces]MYT29257.1 condensation protein [Streptomyces sp. SID8354]
MAVQTHPASVGQRLLWMIGRHRPDYGALNCPAVCELAGPLDLEALTDAVGRLVERHAALRTTITGRGRSLVQQVHETLTLPLEREDLGTAPDPDAALRAAVAEEVGRPLDPTTSPLRARLWRLSPNRHVLCLTAHHLVSDAWSTGVLLRDLHALYDDRPDPPPPAWQYTDFTAWQDTFLAGEHSRSHIDYWRRRLRGAQLAPLPPAPAVPERGPALVTARVRPAAAEGLRAVARRCGVTEFSALLAVYFLLLHTLTGRRDLTTATLFANRSRPETRDVVGFLAGMVLLRSRQPARGSFADLVRITHTTVRGAFGHAEVPSQLLSLPELTREPGRRPDDMVFQLVAEAPRLLPARGLSFDLLVPEGLGTRFACDLTLVPVRGGYDALLYHDRAHLADAPAAVLAGSYAELAARAAARPDADATELATGLNW